MGITGRDRVAVVGEGHGTAIDRGNEMTTRTDQHVAYMDSRYMYTDDDGTDHYTDERPVYCGDWRDGGTVLCDRHEAQATIDYPQGWRHYPGDVCKHGKYTGGCGIDWMCGPCEMGE